MITVSVDDIQRDLIGYLRRVQAGETLVVTQADKPLAEIKPIHETAERDVKQLRPYALCEGAFVVPDDFDAPLPEEILSRFEGG
jgi:prevent-host-death family protein